MTSLEKYYMDKQLYHIDKAAHQLKYNTGEPSKILKSRCR